MTRKGILLLVSILVIVGLLAAIGCTQPTASPTPTPSPTTPKPTTPAPTTPSPTTPVPTTPSPTTPKPTPTTPNETKSLIIGVSASMSGAAASWGQVFERAVSLSAEDINKQGGIVIGNTRYLLTVKTYDHAYDPAKATEIAKRMVQVDKVSWIITHGSATTKPIVPYTEENKVIVMHGAGGSDVMTFMPQKYSYRILTAGAPMSVSLLWQWMPTGRPDIKRVMGMEPDDSSGWDSNKDLKALVEKAGLTYVGDIYYKRGTTDFYPILTSAIAQKPDLIHFAAAPTADEGRIVKQARELGYTGAFGITNPYLPQLLDMAKEAVEGVIYTDYIDPGTSTVATPEEKAFYQRFAEAYGLPFNTLAMGIVNGVYPVAQAIQQAQSLDADKIAATLSSGKFNVLGRTAKFGGISVFGPPARQVTLGVVIGELDKDGKPKYEKVVEFPANY